MAELIARSLGDGCLEGEHAPALLIEDSFASLHVFDHFVTNLASQIALGKSHALGLLVVALNRSRPPTSIC
ncbi:unnamed protein product [Musa acuminata subsp. malaccensis]|uniref:(wild Malaysian banana) hypothetical protein n=1 Tax=Musa acuminata subsp. malaccensis TaxID=214687 RepID=A0A804JPC5_MUSAM|nr:unnamed protein product [Musa acuminata subsp. malaccensis]